MQIATVKIKETGETAILSFEELHKEYDSPYVVLSTNTDLVIHDMGFHAKTQAKEWIADIYGDDDSFELEFTE